VNRRELLSLIGGASLLFPIATRRQQKPMPVIGWLAVASPEQSASAKRAARRSG
jgi:hypothetical protein